MIDRRSSRHGALLGMIDRRSSRHGSPHPWLGALLLLCALALGSCGNTLQDQPIGPASLENVIVRSHFPVYWLGLSFHGMQITNVTIDPGGAVAIRYGDCLFGGQYTCVTPLSIVSSPDNSFVPGGLIPKRTLALRGVEARSVEGGTALSIPTGPVVVSVYGRKPSLAAAAAGTMAPVNEVGLPQAPLPAAEADTGFGDMPLASEVPPGVGIPRPHDE
ncbi:MAG TPA: hypothetical protein VK781_13800 [Solirubrobacteraceae bacterium]|jgi:hypothetical protein|nr:hypothetical protein [Solirubrobacteraceae bacterium]